MKSWILNNVKSKFLLKQLLLFFLSKTISRMFQWSWCLPFYHFFICYLAVPQPTLGHYQGESLSHSMFIAAFHLFLTQRSPGSSQRGWFPKNSWAPGGGWNRNLLIQLKRLNPLGHSPHFFIVISFHQPFSPTITAFIKMVRSLIRNLRVYVCLRRKRLNFPIY